MTVPLIDLSLPETEAAAAVHKACTEFGFLYLTNHGVPESLIRELFEMQRKFFALPPEQKETILVDKNNRGFTPMSQWALDPVNAKVPDTHEGLYFGREVPADSEEAKLPLHGPNQWPSEDLVPGYRAVIERYYEAMGELSRRMLRLLAIGLGMEPDYFAASFDRPIYTLRPLHYSATKSVPEDGAFGIGAHSDYGMLTFLLTDGVPGLQICPDRQKGEWLGVPPVEGACICNIGDLLERWTNGCYRSTLHRVVNTTGQERYSIPFFLEPNFECVVEPLPQCCKDVPAKYPPTTCGEHLLSKLRASYAGPAAQAL